MNEQPVELLLVEDNEDDIVLTQKALKQSHLLNLIQVVRDGDEALAYLRRQGKYQRAQMPGLVLLDINMPKKSGLEVLQELKKDPALKHLPVVMLTVSDSEVDIVQSYANGACSFISKPVSFEKLKEVTKQFELYWTLVAKVPPTQR
jgi:CheY-like chemotaxis protein